MIRIASEKYLLADYTKFEGVTPIAVCPLESLTAIITDSWTDMKLVESYRRAQGLRHFMKREPARDFFERVACS